MAYSDSNFFDKLCDSFGNFMTMEQIAKFALTSKVILSYKIDFLDSFHDLLMKGLWKRASNGCIYPLDNCFEKILYVEINEDYEVDLGKSLEKLRNLNAAHKVFAVRSEPVLSSNQNPIGSSLAENSLMAEIGETQVGVVDVGVAETIEENDVPIVNYEGVHNYENGDIQDDADVVLEDKTEYVPNSVHVPGFEVDNIHTHTNASLLANVSRFNLMEPIATSNRAHRYENCIPLHNVNGLVPCLGFTNEINATVECQINCNLIDNTQLPNAYEVLDKMSQPTSCKDTAQQVKAAEGDFVQGHYEYGHYEYELELNAHQDDFLDQKRRMIAKLGALEGPHFCYMVIMSSSTERFFILLSVLFMISLPSDQFHVDKELYDGNLTQNWPHLQVKNALPFTRYESVVKPLMLSDCFMGLIFSTVWVVEIFIARAFELESDWRSILNFKVVHSWSDLSLSCGYVILELIMGSNFRYPVKMVLILLPSKCWNILFLDSYACHHFVAMKKRIHLAIVQVGLGNDSPRMSMFCYPRTISGSSWLILSYTLEDKGDFRGEEDTSREYTWRLFNPLTLWVHYSHFSTSRTNKSHLFLTFIYDPGDILYITTNSTTPDFRATFNGAKVMVPIDGMRIFDPGGGGFLNGDKQLYASLFGYLVAFHNLVTNVTNKILMSHTLLEMNTEPWFSTLEDKGDFRGEEDKVYVEYTCQLFSVLIFHHNHISSRINKSVTFLMSIFNLSGLSWFCELRDDHLHKFSPLSGLGLVLFVDKVVIFVLNEQGSAAIWLLPFIFLSYSRVMEFLCLTLTLTLEENGEYKRDRVYGLSSYNEAATVCFEEYIKSVSFILGSGNILIHIHVRMWCHIRLEKSSLWSIFFLYSNFNGVLIKNFIWDPGIIVKTAYEHLRATNVSRVGCRRRLIKYRAEGSRISDVGARFVDFDYVSKVSMMSEVLLLGPIEQRSIVTKLRARLIGVFARETFGFILSIATKNADVRVILIFDPGGYDYWQEIMHWLKAYQYGGNRFNEKLRKDYQCYVFDPGGLLRIQVVNAHMKRVNDSGRSVLFCLFFKCHLSLILEDKDHLKRRILIHNKIIRRVV